MGGKEHRVAHSASTLSTNKAKTTCRKSSHELQTAANRLHERRSQNAAKHKAARARSAGIALHTGERCLR